MPYNWNAGDYHAHSPEQHRWGMELAERLSLRGGERILDIGCGDGALTSDIAALVPRGSVLGIDTSEEMIGFCREHYPPDRYPNLSFHTCDARDLRFESQFDVVFSNACLHWVTDHRPVLKGIRRALRPGGIALLQMGGRGNAAAIVRCMDAMIASSKWKGYFSGFSFPYGFYEPVEYRRWCLEAGLLPRRVELIPKVMVHLGREALEGWIRTTWLPYTSRVPESLRDAFIAELAGRYCRAHPPDTSGGIGIEMVRLEVEAARPEGVQ